MSGDTDNGIDVRHPIFALRASPFLTQVARRHPIRALIAGDVLKSDLGYIEG